MVRAKSATIDIKVRMKEPLRAKLEKAAKERGISLNAEAVDRLERSFQTQAVLIETLGGKDAYSILKVLGSVAALIQTRTGKTAADWKTGVAIGRAWKRLITEWVPRPPAEWFAELTELPEDRLEMPERPEPPVKPTGGRGLLAGEQDEEEWKAYWAKQENYGEKLEIFLNELNKYQKDLVQKDTSRRKKAREINEAAAVGEEVLGFLRDQENR